ncbi:MAG: NUDIX domain-containing protein [Proteobacteria bacterium]|uniref:ADP-ribose pyrophosphatase n=1 Tax=Candidatus Avisuccinivibrio stercorigallinarum TaxID=2840704 RepID=A0A9D9GTW1_9GAMM|nr:NUDIX domain-containing protein [Candidatus Avisuccinivibrio stercorigallinarum]
MMSDAQKQLAPRFSMKDVTVHERSRLFKKHFALDEYIVSYKKFDGSETPKLVREIFERDQDAVAILPYDAKTDEVVLIEQFRPGAMKDPISPWLIEIVAGLIDFGEHEIDAAMRELNEEAHFKVTPDELKYITAVYPSPGGISERVSVYFANVDATHIDNHGGLEKENEDIRIFKVPAEAAFEACKSGRICNCAALVGLLNLQLAHQEIRQEFLNKRLTKEQH